MVGQAPTDLGFSQKSETRCHNNFSFSENLVFENIAVAEKRAIVAAHFGFWGNAHTHWRSPDHKAHLERLIFGPLLNNVPGLTDGRSGSIVKYCSYKIICIAHINI
jgi:hypothetical protein